MRKPMDLPEKEIVDEYLNTPATFISIAKHYSCSNSTIRRILFNHVEEKKVRQVAARKKVNANLLKNYHSRGWK